jgi:diguanylate cyclase (GGDEF)-like protein
VGKTFDFFVRREQAKHPDDGEWYTFGQFSMDIDSHAISREEPTVFEESGNVCGKFVFLDIHQARFVNTAGEVIGTVGCARDITERKATEAMVHHMAHHDVLTDLPNRSLLTDRLQQALAYSRREIGKLAVLFVDLDRLKPVNDALGHDAGDELLKEAADRLRQVVPRKTDTVSRLGGDEFVVLLTRVNTDQDAATVAEKILGTLAQPFELPPHTIRISASIGIAVFPQHGGDVAQLLRHADAAMYCAKRSGRNAYRFFDPLGASESSDSAIT